MHSETIKIPLDKDKIGIFIKSANRNRFIHGSVDLLHFIALRLLDFHKSIRDFHHAKEYTRDYSQMIEKINKKWQEKELI